MVSRPVWSETHRSAGAQAAAPVNPSARPFRHRLHEGAGDVQRTGPLLKIRVNPRNNSTQSVTGPLPGDRAGWAAERR